MYVINIVREVTTAGLSMSHQYSTLRDWTRIDITWPSAFAGSEGMRSRDNDVTSTSTLKFHHVVTWQWPAVQRTSVVHLDVLVNLQYPLDRRPTANVVRQDEPTWLPFSPSRQIRSPFQGDREPQGQYGIYSVKVVSLDARDNG